MSEYSKRLDIAQHLTDAFADTVRAAYLGGSVGYLGAEAVRPDSDIDYVVVLDHSQLLGFLATPPLQDRVDDRVAQGFVSGEIDFFWVHRYLDGVETNIFVYDADSMRGYLTLASGLTGFLPERPSSNVQRAYGFDGALRSAPRNTRRFADGWLYERSSLVDGEYWGPQPRLDFLCSHEALHGQGLLEELDDAFWTSAVGQLVAEHGPEVDLDLYNLVHTHWVYQKNREKVPERVVRGIREKTRRYITCATP